MQSMMALPTNGELEKQVLLILKDQKVHELYEVKETISKKLNLSKEETS